MSWVAVNIQRILIVSGVLTMAMIDAVVAPDAALRSTFGEAVTERSPTSSSADGGALTTLVDATLIYAARTLAVSGRIQPVS